MSEKRGGGYLLRERDSESGDRVGFVELFFDLVFVFAITQLSHSLLAHPTPLGVAETIMILLAVWWVWIFTTWVTNWLDVDCLPVRLLLFALMGLGLLLSMSIPQAFAERGLIFACAYVAMQFGRTLFMLWALRRDHRDNFLNFVRIAVWLAASGALWIAGGLSDGHARIAWWAAALLIEYAGPVAAFWTPRLGRTATATWDVSGHHMAERCGLFIIIALGESILITGATFAQITWTGATLAGFASAFLGTLALWWIYFNIGAERASHLISHHDDPGRVARVAYTYGHLPIVAGIIAMAAGDELVLAHPLGHAELFAAALIVGGPALYLLGVMLFKRLTAGWVPLSHLVGLGLLAAPALLSLHAAPLLLSLITTAILAMVALWETLSLGTSAREAGTPI